MHTYSIDRDLRAKVVVIIFVLSMIISLVLNDFCSGIIGGLVKYLENSRIKSVVNLLEWLEVNPNFLGIPFWYGILTVVYDKYIWKLLIKWHQIPDLNGKWVGKLISSFGEKSIDMEMEIEQTWSKISFKSIFPQTNSLSYSNVAAIYVDGNNGTEIYFGFKNESYSVQNKMQSYNGYNVLKLFGNSKIKARYFNERENPDPNIKGGNKGIFELERIER